MFDFQQSIRFVYFPPMTFASIRCVSTSPESDSLEAVIKLISDNDLANRRPDIRHFGFTPPYNNRGNLNIDAYERWVTIPDNMDLPDSYLKKDFAGGLYAAYTVPNGHFDRITQLIDRIKDIEGYTLVLNDCDSILEEYLNTWFFSQSDFKDFVAESQIDLLVKVRKC